ncbi:uncharacterized protein LOC122509756 [Leptopilina heterotoma]|uniref:uncharacterized protein LOC122505978 n=1 Tax=Leptopilina heterotoma TaxID=63436 RepID=UPI001CA92C42|nr:uncharacterized protein LOC122505978 [Leptopilina heterotoma]XP_043479931.1 uncharacterized protein LOC122509756 [Leptopilina heterotoma]XP_043479932.1 uncharacterized protein LOC122509756 [Leptopilina heterotoma]
MEDSRGVKRGNCECTHCNEFDWSPSSKSSLCNYCGCPPTKHRRIDEEIMYQGGNGDSNINEEQVGMRVVESNSTLVLEFDGAPLEFDDASFEEHPTLDPTNNKEIAENSKVSKKSIKQRRRPTQSVKKNNTMNKEVQLETLIPTKFPHGIENLAVSGALLSENQKCTIIRETVKVLFSRNLHNKDNITQMSKILCEKFPQLNAKFGLKHEETLGRMFCSLKNLNRNAKNELAEDFSNVILCAEMNKEVSKVGGAAIDLEKVKDLLNKTRSGRMIDATKMNGSQFFDKFPALRRTDLLLWEFAKIVDVPVVNMRDNFLTASVKIASSLELIPNDTFSRDGGMCHILLNIFKLFKSSRNEKERVIKVYPANTIISTIIPSPSDPPRLFGISRAPSYNDLYLMSYVDGVCAFTEKSFEATLLLLAIYWNLNITFPEDMKFQLTLLSVAVLREAAAKTLKHIIKMPSFSKVLNQVQLA